MIDVNDAEEKHHCGHKASWQQMWYSNKQSPFELKFTYVHVGRDSSLEIGSQLYTGKFQLNYQVSREKYKVDHTHVRYLSRGNDQYPTTSGYRKIIRVEPYYFHSFDGMLSLHYTITTHIDLQMKLVVDVGDSMKHHVQDGAHPYSSQLLPNQVKIFKNSTRFNFDWKDWKRFVYPLTIGFVASVQMDVLDLEITKLNYPALIIFDFTYNKFKLNKLWQGDNITRISINHSKNRSSTTNAMIEGYEIEQINGFYIKLVINRFHADGPNTETCNHWGVAVYDSDRFRLIRETKSNWDDPHIKSYRPLLLLCHTMWFRNSSDKHPYVTTHVSSTANVRILWYTFSSLFTEFEIDLTVETSRCRGKPHRRYVLQLEWLGSNPTLCPRFAHSSQENSRQSTQ